jgi:hypothetical protein
MPAVGRDVIGTIRGGHHHRDRARLARLGRPIVYRHQQGVRRRALAQLDGEGRRVNGLDAVWCAAFEGRVRLLCVEERHALTAPPLQRDPAGFGNIAEHHRLPAAAADDAIKQVARSGGQTVIVDDGALAGSEGIAAVSWARS